MQNYTPFFTVFGWKKKKERKWYEKGKFHGTSKDWTIYCFNSLMVTFEEIFEERSFLFIVISLQNTGGIIERMEETIINHR